MACPDLHPSPGSVLSYSSISRKTLAADSLAPQYDTSADPHPPAIMTKPLYDQHPAPNDGQFYPIYHEIYDFSDSGDSAAAAAAAASGHGGWQPAAGSSAMSQTVGGYPHNWDYGLGGVELSFAPSPPGIVKGKKGHEPQPQVPWESGFQGYPGLIGGAMAMASPLSQYVPAEESMGDGCYEPVEWPQPPMGQISPSPSQGSYHASSPASRCGSSFSTYNSCSALPASKAALVEQARFDAGFRPVLDQPISPRDGQSSLGRTITNGGSQAVAESRPQRTNGRKQTIKPTTTTDYTTGTLSPAPTPSPRDSTAAAPYRPVSRSACDTPDQQTPRKIGIKALQPGPRPPAAQQKQKQKPKQKQGGQAQAQTRPNAAPKAQKTRNREAAIKCRAKSKLAVADLEATERTMGSEHQELSATARGLRDQVLQLKSELLAHGNCDDPLIQQYLTNQARMVGGAGGSLAMPAEHDQHQHQHQHQHHRKQSQSQSQSQAHHQYHQRQGGGRA